MSEPFEEFSKIYRWTRDLIITEKIDGTNAQVLVTEDGQVLAGSRNRYITPDADNFGFARWVKEREAELLALGPGRHFGEWWGSGIQRGYGLKNGEKRFSLFNTTRWGLVRPACCHVVPVLWTGMNVPGAVEQAVDLLAQFGSQASPGFMDPEGIVVFHVPSRLMFKKTIKKDEEPKGRGAK